MTKFISRALQMVQANADRNQEERHAGDYLRELMEEEDKHDPGEIVAAKSFDELLELISEHGEELPNGVYRCVWKDCSIKGHENVPVQFRSAKEVIEWVNKYERTTGMVLAPLILQIAPGFGTVAVFAPEDPAFSK